MERIPQVNYETATPEVQKEFDDQIAKHGRITNMKKTLLNSLPAFNALMEWYTLYDNLKGFLSENEVHFLSYSISAQNDCLICSTFFRKILKDSGIEFESFSFSEREKLLIDYGRAIVSNPENISDEIFNKMKALWNNEQIVAITAFSAMMIATNLINTALKVKLDDYLLGY